jgi:predicted glycoside hydrolase/deacetylase ChbG (UPF0249 family)
MKTLGLVLAAALTAAAAAGGAAGAATVQERLGHPASARLLVIHADDLGMSRSVNRATFEALTQGWITSASVLVPCPWFPEVARFAREHPEADLGIHLALNSEWTGYRWGPVAPWDEVPSLLDAEGYLPLLETTVAQQARAAEVERELRAQIEKARGAGLRLSHLDSHMNALLGAPALIDVYRRLSAEYALPILDAELPAELLPKEQRLIDQILSIGPGVPAAEWRGAYERMLAPLGPGVYELIVHLGYDDDEMRGATWDHPDWGAAWRQADLDLVRSPEFRGFLRDQGFVLVSWRDLARASR